MEKQTKILLGIGAAIALYLILKPKKAVTSAVAVVPSEEKPQPKVTGGYPCPDGTIDYDYTDNGVMSPCVGNKSPLDALNRYLKSQVAPTNGKCPSGYYKETIRCIIAPCPEGMCVPYPNI
jgi:hypothetical protein